MLKFDRKKFFDAYRPEHIRLRKALTISQVAGLTFLLDQAEADPLWDSIDHWAYALATAAHETNFSFEPVEEGYYLRPESRIVPFQKKLRYYPWFGRGLVQLTWEDNYRRADRELRAQKPELIEQFERTTGQTFDLLENPEQAKHPLIAYAIMTLGMHQKWFTRYKLSDFDKPKGFDAVNARKIINGLDKATEIAAIWKVFKEALEGAKIEDIPVIDVPSPVEQKIEINTAPTPATEPPKAVEGGGVNDPAVPVIDSSKITKIVTPGGIANGLAAVWAAMNGKWLYVLLFMALGTLLLVVWLTRKTLLDLLRGWLYSDPHRINIK